MNVYDSGDRSLTRSPTRGLFTPGNSYKCTQKWIQVQLETEVNVLDS